MAAHGDDGFGGMPGEQGDGFGEVFSLPDCRSLGLDLFPSSSTLVPPVGSFSQAAASLGGVDLNAASTEFGIFGNAPAAPRRRSCGRGA